MNHVAHGEFCDLSTARPRDVWHLGDASRDVSWARVAAHDFTDFVSHVVVEFEPLSELDKEHHTNVVVPVLTDRNGFDNPV